MSKKQLTKKDLVNEIEDRIQQLRLLQSALQSDRSRKPEALEEYRKRYLNILSKK